jgi:hypothetical protein
MGLPPLQRASELKAPFATILIYAPARFGKTYMTRTAKKPFVIATEIGDTSGLLTLSDMDIPFVKVTTWDDMVLVVQELKKHKRCQYQGTEVDTVIVDSLTGCGELWMEAGQKVMGWSGVWDGAKGKDPRRIYSYVAEKGRQGMKLFFSIAADLVCICREGILEETTGFDQNGNEIKIQYAVPELPGQKLAKELPGWPDATLHGKKSGDKRFLVTQNVGKVVAGIRVPGDINVPKEILPNLDAIIRLMKGDKAALKELDPKLQTA